LNFSILFIFFVLKLRNYLEIEPKAKLKYYVSLLPEAGGDKGG